jgi:uncharacterized membrane protein
MRSQVEVVPKMAKCILAVITGILLLFSPGCFLLKTIHQALKAIGL